MEDLFQSLQSGDDESYGRVMRDLWGKMHVDKTLGHKKADRLIKNVLRENKPIQLNPHRSLRWYYLAAAIAALVFITGSIYLLSNRKKVPARLVQTPTQPFKNDIKPGVTRAILQAGNVQVTLNKTDTSFVLAGNAVLINSGDLQVSDVKPVQYTLITPRGGQYSLVLADGTKVWLNADSKLVYPSIFNRISRDVYLTGEAYFDVKTDAAHPFIVHTEEQNIKVLGTEFNIKAYPDDKESITTLVNGKVQVNSFGKQILLKEGQQATSGNDGQFSLQPDADVKQAIAWKEGYFRFDNTDIHDIMKQLSRWYNVKVDYEKGSVPHEFVAVINRNNNISQILEMLEGTGEIQFSIDGNVVTVMP